jgi:hypothetical protein
VGGEIVKVPGYELRVERMQGRRIQRVRIVARDEDDTDDPDVTETGERSNGVAREPTR